jgi:hypothetical protein
MIILLKEKPLHPSATHCVSWPLAKEEIFRIESSLGGGTFAQ